MEKYVNYDEEIQEARKKAMLDVYSQMRINFRPEANAIMEKIAEGIEPTKLEVFILTCNEPEKIELYRTFYENQERISKNGKIDNRDFVFLIETLKNNDLELENMLRGLFSQRGLIDSDNNKKRNWWSWLYFYLFLG